jgi:hypothetical protein
MGACKWLSFEVEIESLLFEKLFRSFGQGRLDSGLAKCEVLPCFASKTGTSVLKAPDEGAHDGALRSKSRVCFLNNFSDALVKLHWTRLEPRCCCWWSRDSRQACKTFVPLKR